MNRPFSSWVCICLAAGFISGTAMADSKSALLQQQAKKKSAQALQQQARKKSSDLLQQAQKQASQEHAEQDAAKAQQQRELSAQAQRHEHNIQEASEKQKEASEH